MQFVSSAGCISANFISANFISTNFISTKRSVATGQFIFPARIIFPVRIIFKAARLRYRSAWRVTGSISARRRRVSAYRRWLPTTDCLVEKGWLDARKGRAEPRASASRSHRLERYFVVEDQLLAGGGTLEAEWMGKDGRR